MQKIMSPEGMQAEINDTRETAHFRHMPRDVLANILRATGYIVTVLLLFLSVLLFNAAHWVMKTWGIISMDEIVYHLTMPLEGTATDMVDKFISSCVPGAIIGILVLVIALAVLRKKRWMGRIICIFSVAVSAALISYAAYYMWDGLDIETYLENQRTDSDFIRQNYHDPYYTKLTFPEKKQNLIYIYLESMETTYMSKDVGGGFDNNYIPELTKLAEDNVSFSNTDLLGGAQVTTGASWTTGAMFSQSAGVPLEIQLGKEKLANGDNFGVVEENKSFYPEISALGNILEENGYKQELLIGSDARFGGRKNFFTEHGNFSIFDYYTAVQEGKIPGDYQVWWGYEDKKLFEYAKEELTDLAEKNQPFNLTMLTVDTHFEDGYYCEDCVNLWDNNYANVFSCSSKKVDEFVKWIQQQDFYENTTIILTGDHLTMDADFCDPVSDDYTRTVYNAIINPLGKTEDTRTKNRQFTTLDMFPTTLASMGVDIEGNQLGLGVNLFSDKETLCEKYGFDDFNTQLMKSADFLRNYSQDVVPTDPIINDLKGKNSFMLREKVKEFNSNKKEGLTINQ